MTTAEALALFISAADASDAARVSSESSPLHAVASERRAVLAAALEAERATMAQLKDAARTLIGSAAHPEAHARTVVQAEVIAALKGKRPVVTDRWVRDWRASGEDRRNEA